MTVIGILIKRIDAHSEKMDKPLERLDVINNPVIKKVEEGDEKELGIKNALLFSFEFETKYEPAIGNIKFEGELLYKAGKPKEASDIVNEWKKNKKVPKDVAIHVLNAIFRRCILLALNTAAELQLPPPIRFPSFVDASTKEDNK